jgi:hypothetical protein
MPDNPLRDLMRETVRRTTGSSNGQSTVRSRMPGSNANGAGVPDAETTGVVSPSGFFTIGKSRIGGPDRIR